MAIKKERIVRKVIKTEKM